MTLNEIASRAGVRWQPGLVRDTEGNYKWSERAIFDTSNMDLQMYTKLIIEECNRVGAIAFYNDNSMLPLYPSRAILDHFGM